MVGVGQVKLSDKWANGFRTFHGLMSHGFPNCFFMGVTQTGLTTNYCHAIDEQARHIAAILTEVRARGFDVVDWQRPGSSASRLLAAWLLVFFRGCWSFTQKIPEDVLQTIQIRRNESHDRVMNFHRVSNHLGGLFETR
jgi:hypothetical protein